MGLVRSSFLIYETGKIMGAWYKIKTENTMSGGQEGPGNSQANLFRGGGIRPRFCEASNQNSTARVEIVSAHYDTLKGKTQKDGPTITISGTNRFD